MEDTEVVARPNLYGMKMCWKCYAFLHGVTRNTVVGLQARAKEISESGDDKKWDHQGKNQSFHHAPARDAVIKFIHNLQETLGEADPTQKGFFQLPADTKANHFVDFVVTEAQQEGFLCGYSYFCGLWTQYFPKLILPKTMRWVGRSFPFGNCSILD